VVATRETQGVRSPVVAGDPISLVAAEIHLGHGPTVITDDWPKSTIQNMCQRSNSGKPFKNNEIFILRCIKWIRVHAFSKGKSSKNKLRIAMPNF
jgi:hypothetical protein